MSIRLYGSWFSTFARKVATALELKALPYEHVDALAREARPLLLQLNPRAEVPVLTDGDVTVINSSDILQYLDWRYPQSPLYPADISERVTARALERLADERFDPIVVDCSFWHWSQRKDERPAGLIEAGQQDVELVFERLEKELVDRSKPWPFGAPGVVECAWFANLLAMRTFGFKLDRARFPAVYAWLTAMRDHSVFATDAKRTGAFLKSLSPATHELQKLYWSGDRLEWLLSRGFHRWLFTEIEEGRATFPS